MTGQRETWIVNIIIELPAGTYTLTLAGVNENSNGTGACTVSMDQARTVTAAFVADNQVYLPVVRRE